VAITAIPAAIAVPNFLEAQTRSKASRGKVDMRSIATALEAYRTDSHAYPLDSIMYKPWGPLDLTGGPSPILYRLTTPIAYMTSIPKNPFPDESQSPPDFYYRYFTVYGWKRLQDLFPNPARKDEGHVWVLCSHGPDNRTSFGEYALYSEEFLNTIVPHFNGTHGAIYDPTNGTVSIGDIVRVGP